MTKRRLTPKQEKFVQGLISGLSQREAYKQAYSCKRMSDTAIDVQASKLLDNPKITLRYKELMKEHYDKALWTRETAVRELIWLVDKSKADIEEKGVRQANSNAFLGSIKELNELEFKLKDSLQRTAAELEKKAAETEHIKEKTKLLKAREEVGESGVTIIEDIPDIGDD